MERFAHREGAVAVSGPAEAEARYDFYGPHYRRFGSEVAARIRREVHGEDHGQTGWRTAAEQRLIAELLRPRPGPPICSTSLAARAARRWRWRRTPAAASSGWTSSPPASPMPGRQAEERGLADRVPSSRSPIAAAGCRSATARFAAVLCADAVSSLPDRAGTIREWARLLRPGGRLLFTDALVLTGAVTKPELDLRASQGVHLIVPAGCNEAAIAAAGLVLLRVDDTTEEIATIAREPARRARPPCRGACPAGRCGMVRLAPALPRDHRRARGQPPHVALPLPGREAGRVSGRKHLQTGDECHAAAALLGSCGRGGRRRRCGTTATPATWWATAATRPTRAGRAGHGSPSSS